MGSSQSIIATLETVLKHRDIKIAPCTLKNFVKEVDRVAPWYICSGSLTVASWNKLGRDLDRHLESEDLRLGTKAIWKLIKNCLEDEHCQSQVEESQITLERIQDSLSETERSERLGARKKVRAQSEKGPPRQLEESWGERSQTEESCDMQVTGISKFNKQEGMQAKGFMYPIQELKALHIKGREGKDHLESETFDPEDEIELEEEAARYGRGKYLPEEYRLPPSYVKRGQTQAIATAPPPYADCRPAISLLPEEVGRKLGLAFPVFEVAADGQDGQGRMYAPVEYSQIKELAESVRKYGVNANFTIAQLERLARDSMTPSDWQSIAKATLNTMGQFLEWKALWYEIAQEQARLNAASLTPEQQQWTFEMLTGQGRYANNQTNYAWGVYQQISATAIRAWKALTRKGEGATQLTKILQGPQEPFSDFVARMTEAASRIFGETEAAMPLIEQLVFEQATQECRNAIAPRKGKGLQDWLRICRELGGPLTNTGLAAAILQITKKAPMGRVGPCFTCGKMGHLKRDCRSQLTNQPAQDVCTRCGKGNHKAENCRSVRDIQGRPLQPLGKGT
ncbi:igE-binding protein-like, partial [Nannospalax galili]|uniref:igE-binding protein-like n=1 Tax=Nannospalax galili TaxID=1026970 RepID=UPI0004ED2CB5